MQATRLLTIMFLLWTLGTQAFAADDDVRHFLFVGEPNDKAWQIMMDNPTDRKEAVAEAFKVIGGEIVSYYWGLGDGKNYITVIIPNDNELIQAIYLMRLPAGLLNSYQVIELMTSADMSDALKRSAQMIADDTTIGK